MSHKFNTNRVKKIEGEMLIGVSEMTTIRQMTQKGDPMVRVQLPGVVVRMLEASAKKNKRRVQDQFIKSLAETFKHEDVFMQSAEKFLPDLKEVYQHQ